MMKNVKYIEDPKQKKPRTFKEGFESKSEVKSYLMSKIFGGA